MVLKLFPAI